MTTKLGRTHNRKLVGLEVHFNSSTMVSYNSSYASKNAADSEDPKIVKYLI